MVNELSMRAIGSDDGSACAGHYAHVLYYLRISCGMMMAVLDIEHM